jgi:preprotein translocase subunit SecB
MADKRQPSNPTAKDAVFALSELVGKHAKLKQVRLVRSTCERAYEHGPLPDVLCLGLNTEATLAVGAGQLNVEVRYEINARHKAENDAAAMTVTADFLVEYSIKADVPENAAFAFAQATAPFNSWPYWREFVQSMTTRLGMPALTVPLFKLSEIEFEGELPDGLTTEEESPRLANSKKPAKKKKAPPKRAAVKRKRAGQKAKKKKSR